MQRIITSPRKFITNTLLEVNAPPKPSKVEALRRLPLPPRKKFDASSLPPGCVKSFLLDGDVPENATDQAEIARFCLKNKQSQAMAWLFLRLEDAAPGKQQSLQLAHTDEVPPEQRLNSKDAKFLAQWLLKWIGSLPLLNSVNLSDNFIGDDGAKALAEILAKNLPLQHLLVASCDMTEKGTQRILEALLHNTELHSLDVSFNACDTNGTSALCQVLARNDCALRSLDFSHVRRSDKAVRYENFLQPLEEGLAKNTTLQHFGFAYMQLTPGMCKAMRAHVALRSMNLTATHPDKKVSLALIRKPHLEKIDLSDCSLPKDTVRDILAELHESPSIQQVNLSGNKLKGQGQRIADALQHRKKLTSLNLKSCSMSSKDVVAIMIAASTSRTLLALNLRDNDFFTERQGRELDQHLLLNKRAQPAQLNNAANALHILVSQENFHHVPLDLTRSIARFIGAMGAEGVDSLDNLTATAGRLPSLDRTE